MDSDNKQKIQEPDSITAFTIRSAWRRFAGDQLWADTQDSEDDQPRTKQALRVHMKRKISGRLKEPRTARSSDSDES